MTLESGSGVGDGGDSGSGLRTALSDLFLEQLLRNRGGRGDEAPSDRAEDGAVRTNGSVDPGEVEEEAARGVRVVRFEKSAEPMGITLKLNDKAASCTVARILHGGAAHRQGSLHVGDEILEINGTDVTGRSVDQLQRAMKETRGTISLKVIPRQQSRLPALQVRTGSWLLCKRVRGAWV